MFSRIVQCHLKNNRLDDARQALVNELIPQLRRQPGFIDVIESLEPQTGQFVCMTLWKTREDADRYGQTEFAKAATRLREFLVDEPSIQTLQVETSTVHNIAKGKQAAA
jgi:heme-degrading monooxygenase HmoA